MKTLKTGKTSLGNNPRTNPEHAYPDYGNASDLGARGMRSKGSASSGTGFKQGRGDAGGPKAHKGY